MQLSNRSLKLVSGLVWLLFMVRLISVFPNTTLGMVVAVTTIILLSHVVYAGYFLYSHVPKIDGVMLALGVYSAILIIIVPFVLSDYQHLALVLFALFLGAVSLHRRVLNNNFNSKLNGLCRYKIKLEALIMAWIIVQTGLMMLLPASQLPIALAGAIGLIIANIIIIFRHQIYQQFA